MIQNYGIAETAVSRFLRYVPGRHVPGEKQTRTTHPKLGGAPWREPQTF